MVNYKLSQKKGATNHILVLKEKDGQALGPFFNAMDALAKGVSAKLDLLTGHSTTVIQKTIDIAQQLNIPEKEIQSWAVDYFAQTSCQCNTYLQKVN